MVSGGLKYEIDGTKPVSIGSFAMVRGSSMGTANVTVISTFDGTKQLCTQNNRLTLHV